MFFKTKKTELTKTESFALAAAQWYLQELLAEEVKGIHMFFTQVNLKTSPFDPKGPLKVEFEEGQEYKQIILNAPFTSSGIQSRPNRIPKVWGLLVFERDKKTKGEWKLYGGGLHVYHFPHPCSKAPLQFHYVPLFTTFPRDRNDRFFDVKFIVADLGKRLKEFSEEFLGTVPVK